MDRPYTTLFMLESVDGKISTGDTDELDVDKDFIEIEGVKEGISQYYELEKRTNLVSLNTGKVQAKIGANEKDLTNVKKTDVSFVLVDSKPHLNEVGSEYFAKRSKVFYLITSNKDHPTFKLKDKYQNIVIIYYVDKIDFKDAFRKLKTEYGVEKMTIQSGGTLNAELLRLGLIDELSLVMVPCLIGGKDTQALIGGESLHTEADLSKIRVLELISCDKLENSYLRLRYKVINR